MSTSWVAVDLDTTAETNDCRRAFERGRVRWPSVEIAFARFARHLEDLGWQYALPPGADDVYLCLGCCVGQQSAYRALEREYFPALRGLLTQRYARADFVEDVLQLVRERLLVGPVPRIGTYRGDGTLAAWLRRIATRLAIDVRRRNHDFRLIAPFEHQLTYSDPADESHADTSDESAHDAESIRRFERALLESIVRLDGADRQLLYLHYVQGLRVDEIATCLGKNRSTVYRRLDAAKARVRRRSIEAVQTRTCGTNRMELARQFSMNCHAIKVDPAIWNSPESACEAR